MTSHELRTRRDSRGHVLGYELRVGETLYEGYDLWQLRAALLDAHAQLGGAARYIESRMAQDDYDSAMATGGPVGDEVQEDFLSHVGEDTP